MTGTSARSQGKSSPLLHNATALLLAAAGVLWALVATLFLSPAFKGLFSEFGGELPALTRLMLTSWGPLVLALLVVGVVAASCAGRSKVLPLVLAAVGLLVQPAGFVVAMYLPVFALARSIQ